MEPKKTDEELVASFQSGDNSAFNLLLERYKGIIFKIANSSKCEYGYICDLDFDEIVSTLYFTLFNAAKKFDLNGNHFKSYFNVIAKNEIIAMVKSNLLFYENKRAFYYLGSIDEIEGVLASEDDVKREVNAKIELDFIKKILHDPKSDLRKEYVVQFELFYFEGYSIAQLVNLYHLKEATIRRRINSVKAKVINILYNSKE